MKSTNPELQTEGVKLLQGMFSYFDEFGANEVEIYSASPSHRRECTYYIAVGYYKLRNYSHARKFNGEPSPLPLPHNPS